MCDLSQCLNGRYRRNQARAASDAATSEPNKRSRSAADIDPTVEYHSAPLTGRNVRHATALADAAAFFSFLKAKHASVAAGNLQTVD